jgi:hypothetical protein
MIKSLGQTPNKKMIDEIMHEAEGGSSDSNGKIELREFLNWYGKMLKKKKNTMREDVEDVYRALGGEPVEVGQDETKPVTKEEFAAKLKAEFDLDVDADSVFNSFGKDLKMTDFEGLLMTGDK